MWELRSVGFRTDSFLVAFDGIVEDRGRYVVVRTPSNPDFWWGNFLLYPDAPDASAVVRGHENSWLDDHAREFPLAKACLLAWDRPDGDAGAAETFVSEGFEVDDSSILTVTEQGIHPPPRWSDDVVVAPLDTDAHWEAAAHTLTNAFAPNRSGTMDDLRVFVERQLVRYRRMQEKRFGQWFGGFVGDEIAGVLGVVRQAGGASGASGGDLGRFQLVGTDPKFARRGVCSTLVYGAARVALDEMGVTKLVMAADATYHAAKVYESVGFVRTEKLIAVLRKPPRA